MISAGLCDCVWIVGDIVEFTLPTTPQIVGIVIVCSVGQFETALGDLISVIDEKGRRWLAHPHELHLMSHA